mgnify:CR=1 FL=1
MSGIVKTAAETVQSNGATVSSSINVVGRILEATRNVTGPQAAIVVGTAAVLTMGTCFAVDKVSDFIKGNYVKDIDFKNKKVAFNNPRSASAA